MDSRSLREIVFKIVDQMTTGELNTVESHRSLVKEIKQAAPGVDGRKAWNVLSYVIHLNITSCELRHLWRNRFSKVGVHGKGSRRELVYNPDACGECGHRIECLTKQPYRGF
jgi:hypothetical protein